MLEEEIPRCLAEAAVDNDASFATVVALRSAALQLIAVDPSAADLFLKEYAATLQAWSSAHVVAFLRRPPSLQWASAFLTLWRDFGQVAARLKGAFAFLEDASSGLRVPGPHRAQLLNDIAVVSFTETVAVPCLPHLTAIITRSFAAVRSVVVDAVVARAAFCFSVAGRPPLTAPANPHVSALGRPSFGPPNPSVPVSSLPIPPPRSAHMGSVDASVTLCAAMLHSRLSYSISAYTAVSAAWAARGESAKSPAMAPFPIDSQSTPAFTTPLYPQEWDAVTTAAAVAEALREAAISACADSHPSASSARLPPFPSPAPTPSPSPSPSPSKASRRKIAAYTNLVVRRAAIVAVSLGVASARVDVRRLPSEVLVAIMCLPPLSVGAGKSVADVAAAVGGVGEVGGEGAASGDIASGTPDRGGGEHEVHGSDERGGGSGEGSDGGTLASPAGDSELPEEASGSYDGTAVEALRSATDEQVAYSDAASGHVSSERLGEHGAGGDVEGVAAAVAADGGGGSRRRRRSSGDVVGRGGGEDGGRASSGRYRTRLGKIPTTPDGTLMGGVADGHPASPTAARGTAAAATATGHFDDESFGHCGEDRGVEGCGGVRSPRVSAAQIARAALAACPLSLTKDPFFLLKAPPPPSIYPVGAGVEGMGLDRRYGTPFGANVASFGAPPSTKPAFACPPTTFVPSRFNTPPRQTYTRTASPSGPLPGPLSGYRHSPSPSALGGLAAPSPHHAYSPSTSQPRRVATLEEGVAILRGLSEVLQCTSAPLARLRSAAEAQKGASRRAREHAAAHSARAGGGGRFSSSPSHRHRRRDRHGTDSSTPTEADDAWDGTSDSDSGGDDAARGRRQGSRRRGDGRGDPSHRHSRDQMGSSRSSPRRSGNGGRSRWTDGAAYDEIDVRAMGWRAREALRSAGPSSEGRRGRSSRHRNDNGAGLRSRGKKSRGGGEAARRAVRGALPGAPDGSYSSASDVSPSHRGRRDGDRVASRGGGGKVVGGGSMGAREASGVGDVPLHPAHTYTSGGGGGGLDLDEEDGAWLDSQVAAAFAAEGVGGGGGPMDGKSDRTGGKRGTGGPLMRSVAGGTAAQHALGGPLDASVWDSENAPALSPTLMPRPRPVGAVVAAVRLCTPSRSEPSGAGPSSPSPPRTRGGVWWASPTPSVSPPLPSHASPQPSATMRSPALDSARATVSDGSRGPLSPLSPPPPYAASPIPAPSQSPLRGSYFSPGGGGGRSRLSALGMHQEAGATASPHQAMSPSQVAALFSVRPSADAPPTSSLRALSTTESLYEAFFVRPVVKTGALSAHHQLKRLVALSKPILRPSDRAWDAVIGGGGSLPYNEVFGTRAYGGAVAALRAFYKTTGASLENQLAALAASGCASMLAPATQRASAAAGAKDAVVYGALPQAASPLRFSLPCLLSSPLPPTLILQLLEAVSVADRVVGSMVMVGPDAAPAAAAYRRAVCGSVPLRHAQNLSVVACGRPVVVPGEGHVARHAAAYACSKSGQLVVLQKLYIMLRTISPQATVVASLESAAEYAAVSAAAAAGVDPPSTLRLIPASTAAAAGAAAAAAAGSSMGGMAAAAAASAALQRSAPNVEATERIAAAREVCGPLIDFAVGLAEPYAEAVRRVIRVWLPIVQSSALVQTVVEYGDAFDEGLAFKTAGGDDGMGSGGAGGESSAHTRSHPPMRFDHARSGTAAREKSPRKGKGGGGGDDAGSGGPSKGSKSRRLGSGAAARAAAVQKDSTARATFDALTAAATRLTAMTVRAQAVAQSIEEGGLVGGVVGCVSSSTQPRTRSRHSSGITRERRGGSGGHPPGPASPPAAEGGVSYGFGWSADAKAARRGAAKFTPGSPTTVAGRVRGFADASPTDLPIIKPAMEGGGAGGGGSGGGTATSDVGKGMFDTPRVKGGAWAAAAVAAVLKASVAVSSPAAPLSVITAPLAVPVDGNVLLPYSSHSLGSVATSAVSNNDGAAGDGPATTARKDAGVAGHASSLDGMFAPLSSLSHNDGAGVGGVDRGPADVRAQLLAGSKSSGVASVASGVGVHGCVPIPVGGAVAAQVARSGYVPLPTSAAVQKGSWASASGSAVKPQGRRVGTHPSGGVDKDDAAISALQAVVAAAPENTPTAPTDFDVTFDIHTHEDAPVQMPHELPCTILGGALASIVTHANAVVQRFVGGNVLVADIVARTIDSAVLSETVAVDAAGRRAAASYRSRSPAGGGPALPPRLVSLPEALTVYVDALLRSSAQPPWMCSFDGHGTHVTRCVHRLREVRRVDSIVYAAEGLASALTLAAATSAGATLQQASSLARSVTSSLAADTAGRWLSCGASRDAADALAGIAAGPLPPAHALRLAAAAAVESAFPPLPPQRGGGAKASCGRMEQAHRSCMGEWQPHVTARSAHLPAAAAGDMLPGEDAPLPPLHRFPGPSTERPEAAATAGGVQGAPDGLPVAGIFGPWAQCAQRGALCGGRWGCTCGQSRVSLLAGSSAMGDGGTAGVGASAAAAQVPVGKSSLQGGDGAPPSEHRSTRAEHFGRTWLPAVSVEIGQLPHSATSDPAVAGAPYYSYYSAALSAAQFGRALPPPFDFGESTSATDGLSEGGAASASHRTEEGVTAPTGGACGGASTSSKLPRCCDCGVVVPASDWSRARGGSVDWVAGRGAAYNCAFDVRWASLPGMQRLLLDLYDAQCANLDKAVLDGLTPIQLPRLRCRECACDGDFVSIPAVRYAHMLGLTPRAHDTVCEMSLSVTVQSIMSVYKPYLEHFHPTPGVAAAYEVGAARHHGLLSRRCVEAAYRTRERSPYLFRSPPNSSGARFARGLEQLVVQFAVDAVAAAQLTGTIVEMPSPSAPTSIGTLRTKCFGRSVSAVSPSGSPVDEARCLGGGSPPHPSGTAATGAVSTQGPLAPSVPSAFGSVPPRLSSFLRTQANAGSGHSSLLRDGIPPPRGWSRGSDGGSLSSSSVPSVPVSRCASVTSATADEDASTDHGRRRSQRAHSEASRTASHASADSAPRAHAEAQMLEICSAKASVGMLLRSLLRSLAVDAAEAGYIVREDAVDVLRAARARSLLRTVEVQSGSLCTTGAATETPLEEIIARLASERPLPTRRSGVYTAPQWAARSAPRYSCSPDGPSEPNDVAGCELFSSDDLLLRTQATVQRLSVEVDGIHVALPMEALAALIPLPAAGTLGSSTPYLSTPWFPPCDFSATVSSAGAALDGCAYVGTVALSLDAPGPRLAHGLTRRSPLTLPLPPPPPPMCELLTPASPAALIVDGIGPSPPVRTALTPDPARTAELQLASDPSHTLFDHEIAATAVRMRDMANVVTVPVAPSTLPSSAGGGRVEGGMSAASTGAGAQAVLGGHSSFLSAAVGRSPSAAAIASLLTDDPLAFHAPPPRRDWAPWARRIPLVNRSLVAACGSATRVIQGGSATLLGGTSALWAALLRPTPCPSVFSRTPAERRILAWVEASALPQSSPRGLLRGPPGSGAGSAPSSPGGRRPISPMGSLRMNEMWRGAPNDKDRSGSVALLNGATGGAGGLASFSSGGKWKGRGGSPGPLSASVFTLPTAGNPQGGRDPDFGGSMESMGGGSGWLVSAWEGSTTCATEGDGSEGGRGEFTAEEIAILEEGGDVYVSKGTGASFARAGSCRDELMHDRLLPLDRIIATATSSAASAVARATTREALATAYILQMAAVACCSISVAISTSPVAAAVLANRFLALGVGQRFAQYRFVPNLAPVTASVHTLSARAQVQPFSVMGVPIGAKALSTALPRCRAAAAVLAPPSLGPSRSRGGRVGERRSPPPIVGEEGGRDEGAPRKASCERRTLCRRSRALRALLRKHREDASQRDYVPALARLRRQMRVCERRQRERTWMFAVSNRRTSSPGEFCDDAAEVSDVDVMSALGQLGGGGRESVFGTGSEGYDSERATLTRRSRRRKEYKRHRSRVVGGGVHSDSDPPAIAVGAASISDRSSAGVGSGYESTPSSDASSAVGDDPTPPECAVREWGAAVLPSNVRVSVIPRIPLALEVELDPCSPMQYIRPAPAFHSVYASRSRQNAAALRAASAGMAEGVALAANCAASNARPGSGGVTVSAAISDAEPVNAAACTRSYTPFHLPTAALTVTQCAAMVASVCPLVSWLRGLPEAQLAAILLSLATSRSRTRGTLQWGGESKHKESDGRPSRWTIYRLSEEPLKNGGAGGYVDERTGAWGECGPRIERLTSTSAGVPAAVAAAMIESSFLDTALRVAALAPTDVWNDAPQGRASGEDGVRYVGIPQRVSVSMNFSSNRSTMHSPATASAPPNIPPALLKPMGSGDGEERVLLQVPDVDFLDMISGPGLCCVNCDVSGSAMCDDCERGSARYILSDMVLRTAVLQRQLALSALVMLGMSPDFCSRWVSLAAVHLPPPRVGELARARAHGVTLADNLADGDLLTPIPPNRLFWDPLQWHPADAVEWEAADGFLSVPDVSNLCGLFARRMALAWQFDYALRCGATLSVVEDLAMQLHGKKGKLRSGPLAKALAAARARGDVDLERHDFTVSAAAPPGVTAGVAFEASVHALIRGAPTAQQFIPLAIRRGGGARADAERKARAAAATGDLSWLSLDLLNRNGLSSSSATAVSLAYAEDRVLAVFDAVAGPSTSGPLRSLLTDTALSLRTFVDRYASDTAAVSSLLPKDFLFCVRAISGPFLCPTSVDARLLIPPKAVISACAAYGGYYASRKPHSKIAFAHAMAEVTMDFTLGNGDTIEIACSGVAATLLSAFNSDFESLDCDDGPKGSPSAGGSLGRSPTTTVVEDRNAPGWDGRRPGEGGDGRSHREGRSRRATSPDGSADSPDGELSGERVASEERDLDSGRRGHRRRPPTAPVDSGDDVYDTPMARGRSDPGRAPAVEDHLQARTERSDVRDGKDGRAARRLGQPTTYNDGTDVSTLKALGGETSPHSAAVGAALSPPTLAALSGGGADALDVEGGVAVPASPLRGLRGVGRAGHSGGDAANDILDTDLERAAQEEGVPVSSGPVDSAGGAPAEAGGVIDADAVDSDGFVSPRGASHPSASAPHSTAASVCGSAAGPPLPQRKQLPSDRSSHKLRRADSTTTSVSASKVAPVHPSTPLPSPSAKGLDRPRGDTLRDARSLPRLATLSHFPDHLRNSADDRRVATEVRPPIAFNSSVSVQPRDPRNRHPSPHVAKHAFDGGSAGQVVREETYGKGGGGGGKASASQPSEQQGGGAENIQSVGRRTRSLPLRAGCGGAWSDVSAGGHCAKLAVGSGPEKTSFADRAADVVPRTLSAHPQGLTARGRLLHFDALSVAVAEELRGPSVWRWRGPKMSSEASAAAERLVYVLSDLHQRKVKRSQSAPSGGEGGKGAISGPGGDPPFNLPYDDGVPSRSRCVDSAGADTYGSPRRPRSPASVAASGVASAKSEDDDDDDAPHARAGPPTLSVWGIRAVAVASCALHSAPHDCTLPRERTVPLRTPSHSRSQKKTFKPRPAVPSIPAPLAALRSPRLLSVPASAARSMRSARLGVEWGGGSRSVSMPLHEPAVADSDHGSGKGGRGGRSGGGVDGVVEGDSDSPMPAARDGDGHHTRSSWVGGLEGGASRSSPTPRGGVRGSRRAASGAPGEGAVRAAAADPFWGTAAGGKRCPPSMPRRARSAAAPHNAGGEGSSGVGADGSPISTLGGNGGAGGPTMLDELRAELGARWQGAPAPTDADLFRGSWTLFPRTCIRRKGCICPRCCVGPRVRAAVLQPPYPRLPPETDPESQARHSSAKMAANEALLLTDSHVTVSVPAFAHPWVPCGVPRTVGQLAALTGLSIVSVVRQLDLLARVGIVCAAPPCVVDAFHAWSGYRHLPIPVSSGGSGGAAASEATMSVAVSQGVLGGGGVVCPSSAVGGAARRGGAPCVPDPNIFPSSPTGRAAEFRRGARKPASPTGGTPAAVHTGEGLVSVLATLQPGGNFLPPPAPHPWEAVRRVAGLSEAVRKRISLYEAQAACVAAEAVGQRFVFVPQSVVVINPLYEPVSVPVVIRPLSPWVQVPCRPIGHVDFGSPADVFSESVGGVTRGRAGSSGQHPDGGVPDPVLDAVIVRFAKQCSVRGVNAVLRDEGTMRKAGRVGGPDAKENGGQWFTAADLAKFAVAALKQNAVGAIPRIPQRVADLLDRSYITRSADDPSRYCYRPA